MRIALAVIAIALASLAAGAAPAATPRLAIVDCDDAARSVAQPGGKLYGARLGFSWGARAKKLAPSQDASFPFWSKLPIFIRAGGRAFTIAIAPSWHERAGMAWDSRGDAQAGDRPRSARPALPGRRQRERLARVSRRLLRREAGVPADRDHDRRQALPGARAPRPRLPLS